MNQEELSSKAAFLSEYGAEDMELFAKKEAVDAERKDALRKKAMDEEAKKKERKAKAENDFDSWMQYLSCWSYS